MKTGFSISIIGHLGLLLVSLIITMKSASAWKNQVVYQIELLSLPQESTSSLIAFNSGKKNIRIRESEEALNNNFETYSSNDNQDLLTAPLKPVNRLPSKIQLNTLDFPFSYYLQIMEYRIKQNWAPPYEAIGNDNERRAVISFQVLKNGQIDKVDLINQSGKFLFDQAAIRSILNTRNLPPLPETYPNDYLTVSVEFEVIK